MTTTTTKWPEVPTKVRTEVQVIPALAGFNLLFPIWQEYRHEIVDIHRDPIIA